MKNGRPDSARSDVSATVIATYRHSESLTGLLLVIITPTPLHVATRKQQWTGESLDIFDKATKAVISHHK